MSCYATLPDDFYTHGIRAAALPASVGAPEILALVTAASGLADSYLGSRFRLPLSNWGVDLTQAVCAIAAYELLTSQIGFNPEAGHNLAIVDRKNDRIRWLEKISAGLATPVGIVDSPPAAASVSRVYSNTPRGWR